MDWYHFVRKYVWDEQKTPYFTRVDKLTKRQARNELLIFAIFVGSVAVVVDLAALADFIKNRNVVSLGVAAYAGTVLAAVLLLARRAMLRAALYCLTAPLAVFLFFIVQGFPPKLQELDHYVLLAIILLWLLYTVRVVAIAKVFPAMREGTEQQ